MWMTVIEPKKNSNDVIKTEFKLTKKEFVNTAWLRGWLKLAGADLNNPTKENSRFVYFVVNGDYLNKPKS